MLPRATDGPSHPAVLITGASTGIGQACATRLAREGFHVFAGVRKPEAGERLAKENAGIEWLILDVTNPEQIAAAQETITVAVGEAGLAGLLNNAGIALGGPLEYLSSDVLRRQMEVNLIGVHAVTRAFLPLIRRGRGRIVQMSSISGKVASPWIGPYTASKHAVEGWSDALRYELAAEGIPVVLIEPGQVRTPIWDKAVAGFDRFDALLPPEGRERYGRRLRVFQWLLQRAPRVAVQPERVADAVAHALLAPEPRIRYVVGSDAKLRLLLSRLLPARLMDTLLLGALGRIERRLP